MGRPRKDAVKVKTKKVKAKQNTGKKIKDSFLKIGQHYQFSLGNESVDGKLINASKTEYLVKDEEDHEFIIVRVAVRLARHAIPSNG